MDNIEFALYLFIALFIIIFLVDFIFIKLNYLRKLKSKKKKKKVELTELTYLINKFKLDKKDIKIKWLLVIFSFINAFIISLVGVTIILLDIFILFQLIIGFILLIGLIYSMYELLGRYLVKKGSRENGK